MVLAGLRYAGCGQAALGARAYQCAPLGPAPGRPCCAQASPPRRRSEPAGRQAAPLLLFACAPAQRAGPRPSPAHLPGQVKEPRALPRFGRMPEQQPLRRVSATGTARAGRCWACTRAGSGHSSRSTCTACWASGGARRATRPARCATTRPCSPARARPTPGRPPTCASSWTRWPPPPRRGCVAREPRAGSPEPRAGSLLVASTATPSARPAAHLNTPLLACHQTRPLPSPAKPSVVRASLRSRTRRRVFIRHV
jgi:hypothetical protein